MERAREDLPGCTEGRRWAFERPLAGLKGLES